MPGAGPIAYCGARGKAQADPKMANSDDKASARPDARHERLAKALRANLVRRKAAARAAAKGSTIAAEQGRRSPLEPEPKD